MISTSKHKLIEKFYGAYARAGGEDGKDVFRLRAQNLGYDEPFLQQDCGLHNDHQHVVYDTTDTTDTTYTDGNKYDDTYTALLRLSCGSGCPLRLRPSTATATPILTPNRGQTVLDLGSGGGHDAVLASRIVGPAGRVVGIDLSRDMVRRARAAAAAVGPGGGRVSFVRAPVDEGGERAYAAIRGELAPGDADGADGAAADVVISNGVINLCEDKRAAFALAYRCLVADGSGYFLLSDLCTVPRDEDGVVSCRIWSDDGDSGGGWVNWVQGCVKPEEYVGMMEEVGFVEVEVVGYTDFWTSETTRGVDFVARKPMVE